jgi:TusA-related sulfurtransferase
MIIDVRGHRHPEHIKEFKRHLEGLCAVYEDITVITDDIPSDVKKLEMYLKSCNAKYTVTKEKEYLKINISAPFYLCG